MAGIGKLSAVANQFTGVGIVAIVAPETAAGFNYVFYLLRIREMRLHLSNGKILMV